MKEPNRGDLYYADLSPIVGSEQDGIRPVLIIQNDVGNHYSPTVIVASITGRKKKYLPTHVVIHTNFLQHSSRVMLEQIRTLDKGRLREYLGQLDSHQIAKVDKAICISLGLEGVL